MRHVSDHDKILKLVSAACNQPSNRFGQEFLVEHLLLVESYAVQMAKDLDANTRLIQAASLLHDLAAIRDYGCVAIHGERGADLAAQLLGPGGELADIALSHSEIDQVCVCIREHSCPVPAGKFPAEVVCVSSADAMSQIARPLYWFHYARQVKQLGYYDALTWYGAMIDRNYKALCERARTAIEREYRVASEAVRAGRASRNGVFRH